jgi:thioredoxin 1
LFQDFSATKDTDMNRFRLYGLSGLLLVVAAVSGCTEGGVVAFRHADQNEFPELLVEASVIQQSAVKSAESGSTAKTLVSTASTHEPAGSSLITLARGDDLNAKIQAASGPVLLDFYADWCGPCRTQGRILHDMEGTAAKTHTVIIKINIDEHPELAEQLQVDSLPTLMMIKNGKIVERQSGVANKNRLLAWMR